MTTDWSDWNPHPHMALAQYTQRVPLARNASSIVSLSGSIAAGGFTNAITNAPIDQPSFQMLLSFEYTSVTATIPFGKLRFLWTDTASGFQVDPDWCILPGAFAATEFYYISGPAKADQLTLEITNLDPAQILFFNSGASSVSHVYERIRVQEVSGGPIPQFTRPGLNNQMGILGSVGALLAVSSHVDRLASTWGGVGGINVDNTAGTVPVIVQLLDPGVIAGGTPLYGTANSGILWSTTVAAGATSNAELPLPYGPVVIREINSSAASTVQPTTTLIRLEP